VARYSANLTDQYGRPLGGALVYVSVSSTGALAALTNDDTSTLSNPFHTSSTGAIVFNTSPDFYDMAYWFGGRLIRQDFAVNVGAVSGLPAGSVANSLSPGATNVAPSQAAVLGIVNGTVQFNLPDEALGQAIPAPGSKLPYLSGGVLKIA
jgi:hypothetical protein